MCMRATKMKQFVTGDTNQLSVMLFIILVPWKQGFLSRKFMYPVGEIIQNIG